MTGSLLLCLKLILAWHLCFTELPPGAHLERLAQDWVTDVRGVYPDCPDVLYYSVFPERWGGP